MIGRLIVVFFAISAVFGIFWLEQNVWRVDKESKLVKIQNIEYGFEVEMWENVKEYSEVVENEKGRMNYWFLKSNNEDTVFVVNELTYIPKTTEIDHISYIQDEIPFAIQDLGGKLKNRPISFYENISGHIDSFEVIDKNNFVTQTIYLAIPEKRKIYGLYAGFYESPENRQKAYQFFKSFKLK